MSDTVVEPLKDSVEVSDNPNRKHLSKRRLKKDRAFQRQGKLPKTDYRMTSKENDNIVKYYQSQVFLQDKDEFEKFMGSLKETLPASFRINTFDLEQAHFLRHFIESSEFEQFLKVPRDHTTSRYESSGTPASETPSSNKVDDLREKEQSIDAISIRPSLEPLVWYPKGLGWQMNLSRVDLRKTPLFQRFHKFLMAETDNGFISRQEAVSMIPPLVLDVQYGQNILDMCAAPGSKTAQLLEYLKHNLRDPSPLEEQTSRNSAKGLIDDGMVVANDLDNRRCYMLVHQSSRLNSPNCVIINQDASQLPDLKTFSNEGDEYCNLKFDRILCDVPCTGDGTVRKNPNVWKKWSIANSNNFHGIQCKILRRGMELLKKDGLLVYSTCSMTPVEDEAVVASILRASKGEIELVDVKDKLPGLRYIPGVSSWVVMAQQMKVMTSVEEVPSELTNIVHPSLFPPTQEEAKNFNLHRCIRVLPHLQNTGGFFVAVLRKLSSNLTWERESTKQIQSVKSESDEKRPDDSQQELVRPTRTKKRKFQGFKEEPFLFMDDNDPDWIALKSGYGLKDNFPVDQLAHRSTSGKKRSIYLVAKRTRNFMLANREETNRKAFVKIINAGMRLFTKATTESGFRICQDGVNEISPYIRDDIKVLINKADLVALLKSKTVAIDKLSQAGFIREKIKSGSFILVYRHVPDNEDGLKVEMPLAAWKGEYTIALYVSTTYRVHLCAIAQLNIDDDASTQGETKRQLEQQPQEVHVIEQ